MDKTLFSTKQAAEMLHISKSTLYELLKRGEIDSCRIGRNIKLSQEHINAYLNRSQNQSAGYVKKSYAEPDLIFAQKRTAPSDEFVICGQDLMLDVISNYMRLNGIQALRAYVGSFESLLSLYHNKVQVASAHLWEYDRDEYNVEYVRRLMPGVPAVLIHLTCRMQGFFVAKGNPKGIKGWEDLTREDITMINREKGSGSRVLLDGKLRAHGISASQVNGYENETSSHLTVASAVSRGEADLGLGTEKISRQVEGIDFIPLQKESYDLVVKKEHLETEAVQTMLRIIRSDEFRTEFMSVGGYDTKDMGVIVAET